MAHACHPGTWEVRAERSEVQGHPWLHVDFKANSGYMRPSLEKGGGGSGGLKEYKLTFIGGCFTRPGNTQL